MSQTLLLSGVDRNPVLNLHYSPEHAPSSHLAHLSDKHSPWTSQSSSMMETQSFTARRSAASSLPQFQLPPPDHLSALHGKYPAYAPTSQSQPTPPVSSVLTPPTGLGNEGLSPLASSVNSNASSASSNGAPAYQPQPMGFWPAAQNPPSYQYSSAPLTNSYQSYSRPIYSPPMNFPNRNPDSPTAGQGLPPPPYDISLPPFPSSMGGSGGSQQSLPTLAPQQQSQPQQQLSNSGMMNSQAPSSQPPPQGPLHAPETYGGRPPPTPTYYTPASTPQQPSFPAYTQQSPTQASPNTSGPPQNRVSPVSAHPLHAPQNYQPRPYSGYSLPAMPGPIMSNVHNPGSQMALVGGNMQMQYPPMGGQIYGHHPGQPQPQNERPFKCDQCPQSFNRNHDLKRHKRIHLAVKPFPCGHCEKSFSRKDALKRHILVKGCGDSNKKAANGLSANANSQSPVDKSEVLSDSASDSSPQMMKKEL